MSCKNIAILLSSNDHPIFTYLERWVEQHAGLYNISFVNLVSELPDSADILFLVSCTELVSAEIRNRFDYTLVLHASALPEGRGWSPHIWGVVEGKDEIVLTLLNAEDKVDTGDIWAQEVISLDGTELYDEINHKLFVAELNLISWACENIENCQSTAQSGPASYYSRRTPEDSQLDPLRSIAEQFNLLRVCDPHRFPAYFEYRGQRYNVKLEKAADE